MRILISRLSAVGDCVHTLPLLAALRREFPTAHLAWCVQPGPGQLLNGHPDLDELIFVPKGWLKRPRDIAEMRGKLIHRFDVSIDPQSLTKSSALGWLSGAARRIGFARPQGRELSRWLNNHRVPAQSDHVVDRYLELLEPLGVFDKRVEFRFPPFPLADESVDKFTRSNGIGERFFIINPGAGWDSKLWPSTRYSDVVRHVGIRHQIPAIVVWAGPREKEWAKQIVQNSNNYALMAPDTSLPELLQIVRRAAFFVGSDTGPLHMAAAVGTPCIGMYGPTRPAVCGPYGQEHITIQAYHQDGSSKERRGQNNDAMRKISTAEVCDAIDRMVMQIGRTRTHGAA